jgi:cytochrome c2
MSTRMIMSIAFVASVVLGMLVYILLDNNRAEGADLRIIEKKAHVGAKLFAANCSQCHGPLGEGAIGPAIQRKTWKGTDPANDNVATRDFLLKVLQRGQTSPQPGAVSMPAWAKEYGGAFDDEQIEDVILFLMYGHWDETLTYIQTPNYNADLPANEDQQKRFPNALTDQTQKAALAKELGEMKTLLQAKACINCHAFGSLGAGLGPNLSEVGSRRTDEWLNRWIEDPTKVAPEDRGPNILPWFNLYPQPRTEPWPMNETQMPKIEMTQAERTKIVNYLVGLVAPKTNTQINLNDQTGGNTAAPKPSPTPKK